MEEGYGDALYHIDGYFNDELVDLDEWHSTIRFPPKRNEILSSFFFLAANVNLNGNGDNKKLCSITHNRVPPTNATATDTHVDKGYMKECVEEEMCDVPPTAKQFIPLRQFFD